MEPGESTSDGGPNFDSADETIEHLEATWPAPTGLCSHHQHGEDPSCLRCYPAITSEPPSDDDRRAGWRSKSGESHYFWHGDNWSVCADVARVDTDATSDVAAPRCPRCTASR